MEKIVLKVNHKEYNIYIEPHETLLTVLRERLDITSPKRGCEMGECGACTVILDGKAVNSCLVLAMECQGKEIVTLEGIKSNGELHPLQKAFIEHGAVQCGFCTPGMIMSGKALLDENPDPTQDQIKTAISGNLCRCTGYAPIVNAIKSVATLSTGEGK